MSYNIKGEIKTTGNMIIQGKQPGLNVSLTGNNITYIPDTSGVIDLPIKLKDGVDSMFNQLPISQYGAINNNKPGVAGSFDGGSTVPQYSAMPVLLENDGSLVYLRPGTNGSSINYYYTYINNPESSMRPYTSINTYYNGSCDNIVFTETDASNCLIYEEIGNGIVHVVMTNGTLNKEHHKEATFDRTKIPSCYISTATVAGSYLYMVCLYGSDIDVNNPTGVYCLNSDPFQLFIYRIPVSEINAGTINTVEKVSGITGNNMYGISQGSQSYMRIADSWATSSNTTNKSFIKYNPAVNSCAPYTYSMPGMFKCIFDGTNININMTTNANSTNDTGRYDTIYSFVTKYNISTKEFTTDLSDNPIIFDGQKTGTINITNPYYVSSNNIYGSELGEEGLHGSVYITNSGTQYYIKEKYLLRDFYSIFSGKINSFTSKVDAYNFRNRSFNNTVHYPVYADYASRVGDQMMGGIPISSSRIIFNGTGTYKGTTYSKDDKGVADIGTTRTYKYKSFTSGTVTGYAPQQHRVPLSTYTYGGVSYCDESGDVSFYGTLLVENMVLSCGYKLDPNTLTYDKTINVSNSTLVSIKNSIISSLGINPSGSLVSLYYSPNTSYFNSVVCISTENSGSGGNIILASVDVTLSGDEITDISLNTIISNYYNSTIVAIPYYGREMSRHGGMSIVKYNDFTYVSLPHAVNIIVPGDSAEYTYAGVKSGSTLTSLILSRSYHVTDSFTTAREYSYIPNYGFGYYMFGKTDKGTKLMFKYCGNTLAEYKSNLADGIGTETVILAQDVIQGFHLYFTEITPVLMNGKFFEMPITSIDLSTVKPNPGNTKFYVYVDSSTGTPQYRASTTEISESETNMYIGNIQTDGTKVSNLNITKVSRFGIYRPSETQIGSAFPVSVGNPAQAGTINW